ncbi:MAG: Tim44-like domain-containing protein [Candidatus Dormiibacterota bacterium]
MSHPPDLLRAYTAWQWISGAFNARRRLVLATSVGLTLLAILIPEVALARGGGGGHSSGGGSSGGSSGGSHGSSSSGSSSGGSSGGFFFVGSGGSGSGGGGAASIFEGICCLLVVIVVVFFIIRAVRRRGRGGAQPAVDQTYTGPVMSDPTQGLADITANDPGFNQEKFLERTQQAFFQLQKAWMDRNVDEGRAYMAPGLYTSWKMQVDQMTAAHKKNVLENLFIQGTQIVKASHDASYDMLTVKVDASAMDYEVNDETGKEVFAVGGKKADRPFTEFWTFQRSAGAKTLVSGGVTDKKCPNCGAPSDVNETGHCKYCNAEVTSGQFDWVLSQITQANDWRG